MAKYHFTSSQFNEIKTLLKRRFSETSEEKKKTRAKIRKLGFNISDYNNGFTDKDFQDLLIIGVIKLVDSPITTTLKKNVVTDSDIPNKKNIEKESLSPILDQNTKILILGTMPGENSLTHQQYYNNPNNQFWKIIFSIFNNNFSMDSYNEKIEILKKNKIGLWDVLKTCEREGSSDANIKSPEINDFETLLKNNPAVEILIFNGKDSYTYFKKFIKSNFDKRLIQLNSTSSINSHISIGDKIEEWKKYLTEK